MVIVWLVLRVGVCVHVILMCCVSMPILVQLVFVVMITTEDSCCFVLNEDPGPLTERETVLAVECWSWNIFDSLCQFFCYLFITNTEIRCVCLVFVLTRVLCYATISRVSTVLHCCSSCRQQF